MAALGDIGTEVVSPVLLYTLTVAIPAWPDISIAMPQDTGSGATNPETFSAYIAG